MSRIGEWLRKRVAEWRKRHWDWAPHDNPPGSLVFFLGDYPPFRRRLQALREFLAANAKPTYHTVLGAAVGAVVGAVATKLLG